MDIQKNTRCKLMNFFTGLQVRFSSFFRKLFRWFMDTPIFVPLDFIKWLIVDIYRRFSSSRPVHLYGIWCFVGVYGGGKTMSLVHYLEEQRRKHGDKIYIATNFFYKGQDFPIERWQDLLVQRDRPIIFGYDELQNEFNSRGYKDFPVQLMGLLSQNRKGHGKQIVYTAQDYETVDKNFRRLTTKVASCRTRFGRLTIVRYYDREDYENLCALTEVKRRMRIRPWRRRTYVQSDYLRDRYDSYQMLESATNKQYMDRVVQ